MPCKHRLQRDNTHYILNSAPSHSYSASNTRANHAIHQIVYSNRHAYLSKSMRKQLRCLCCGSSHFMYGRTTREEETNHRLNSNKNSFPSNANKHYGSWLEYFCRFFYHTTPKMLTMWMFPLALYIDSTTLFWSTFFFHFVIWSLFFSFQTLHNVIDQIMDLSRLSISLKMHKEQSQPASQQITMVIYVV